MRLLLAIANPVPRGRLPGGLGPQVVVRRTGRMTHLLIDRQDSFDAVLNTLFGSDSLTTCCLGTSIDSAGACHSASEPQVGMPELMQLTGGQNSSAMALPSASQVMSGSSGQAWYVPWEPGVSPQPTLLQMQPGQYLQQQPQQQFLSQHHSYAGQLDTSTLISSPMFLPAALPAANANQPRRKVSQAQRNAHKRFRQRQRQQVCTSCGMSPQWLSQI